MPRNINYDEFDSWLTTLPSYKEVQPSQQKPIKIVNDDNDTSFDNWLTTLPSYQEGQKSQSGPEVSGMWGAFKSGAKKTAKGLQTTVNVYSGDDEDVARLTQESQEIPQTPEQEAFQQAVSRRQEESGDDSLWQGVKNMVGAIIEQPKGALHETVGQIANTGVAMGGMITGAKLGAVATAGNPMGAIAGGIIGLFLSNISLETGFIAQQKMAEGEYDSADVIEKGFKKGGTISLIDTATMGANVLMFKSAMGAAAKVLSKAGVNPLDNVAVSAALKASPELRTAVLKAGGQAAMNVAPQGMKKLTTGLTALGLEVGGETAGEYAGSVAAGLEASWTEAVMEGMMSVPQSAGQAGVSYGVSRMGLRPKETDSIDLLKPKEKAEEFQEQVVPTEDLEFDAEWERRRAAKRVRPQKQDPQIVPIDLLAREKNQQEIERIEQEEFLLEEETRRQRLREQGLVKTGEVPGMEVDRNQQYREVSKRLGLTLPPDRPALPEEKGFELIGDRPRGLDIVPSNTIQMPGPVQPKTLQGGLRIAPTRTTSPVEARTEDTPTPTMTEEKTGEVEGKKPWEMPYVNFRDVYRNKIDGDKTPRDFHYQQIQQALSSGELTVEQAEKLGHFEAYPDLKKTTEEQRQAPSVAPATPDVAPTLAKSATAEKPKILAERKAEMGKKKDTKELEPLAKKLWDIKRDEDAHPDVNPRYTIGMASDEAKRFFGINPTATGSNDQLATKLKEYGLEPKGALKKIREMFQEAKPQETPTKEPKPVTKKEAQKGQIAKLQKEYDAAKKALDDIGKEPYKPSNEARYFGKMGREGAPQEKVAEYDEMRKKHSSWNRKYLKLKKAEVEASNRLFDAKKEVKAKEPKPDAKEEGKIEGRDTFTVNRIPSKETFVRGEYVKAWIGKDNWVEGEIAGISHAKKEAKIKNVWFKFGKIYKTEKPKAPAPKGKIQKLSKTIDQTNKKFAPPDGFGEKDAKFSRKEQPNVARLVAGDDTEAGEYFVRFRDGGDEAVLRDIDRGKSLSVRSDDKAYLEELMEMDDSFELVELDDGEWGLQLQGLNGYGPYPTIEDAISAIEEMLDTKKERSNSGEPWVESDAYILKGNYAGDDGMGFDLFSPTGTVFAYEGDFSRENPDIRFRRGTSESIADAAEVQQSVDAIMDKFPGIDKGMVTVRQSEKDLPKALQEQIKEQKAEGQFYAVYYDNGIYLVADNLQRGDIAELAVVEGFMRHEGRHWAIEQIMTEKERSKFFGAAALKYKKEVAQYLRKAKLKNTNKNRVIAAEEIVIEKIKAGETGRLLNKIIAKFSEWLRKLFPNLQVTTAEIRELIRRADRMIEGKEAVGLGSGQIAMASRIDKAPVWYSQLEKTLESKLPGTGSPKQIKQLVDSWQRKGEFKADELDWVGLNNWLDQRDGKVTKQEVLDFVRANNVEIQEVVKGVFTSPPLTSDESGELSRLLKEVDYLGFDDLSDAKIAIAEHEDWADRWDVADEKRLVELGDKYRKTLEEYSDDQTKFSQYQMEGEKENYREVLLTLPKETSPAQRAYDDFKQKMQNKYVAGGQWKQKLNESEAATEDRLAVAASEEKGFRSSHWDEPNVLAHVRLNDRTGPNGEKILFVEEVQSDWHQEGRKKGYGNQAKWEVQQLLSGEWTIGYKHVGTAVITKTRQEAEKILNSQKFVDELGTGPIGVTVPDAPFKGSKNWAMLAMKRLVRMAAEQGYDSIAWTPGEVQAARYDLSKHIKEINYEQDSDGSDNYDFSATDHSGNEVIAEEDIGLARIEELVGKEIAEKVKAGEGRDDSSAYRDWKRLEGLDLKVGGEGMKGFYDKILPAEVNKFFNKKMWGGAKVGVTTIQDQEVWTLPITPEMRQKAIREGMPMFQRKPQFKPVDVNSKEFKNWFKGSKVVDTNKKPLPRFHSSHATFNAFKAKRGSHFGFHFGDVEAANVRLEDTADGRVDKSEYQRLDAIAEEKFNQWKNYEESLRAKSVFPDGKQLVDESIRDGVELYEVIQRYEYKPTEQELKKLSQLREEYDKSKAPIHKLGTGANIGKYYLSIKNPLRLPDIGNWGSVKAIKDVLPFESDAKTLNQLKDDIQRRGYDGIVYNNTVENLVMKTESHIAFEPTQIKSALTNTGAFSKENPDIRFSRKEPMFARTEDTFLADDIVEDYLEAETNLDRAKRIFSRKFNDSMYWIVDKNRPIQTVQKELNNLHDDIDVFLKETQRPKRTAARVQGFWDEHVEPLIKKMAKYRINLPTLELYAHAKHAQEANKALRQANAKMQVQKIIKQLSGQDKKNLQEVSADALYPNEWFDILNDAIEKYGDQEKVAPIVEKWKVFSEKPSGMTDQEAERILQRYKDDTKIEELRKMVSAINKDRLELLFNAGQIAPEEYNYVKNKYKYYVPLYREGFDDSLFGASRGLKPSGRAIKTRGGSTRNVVNILAHTVANYERAINIAEKARSQRALYGLIMENQDSDIIQIEKVKQDKTFDAAGNLKMYPNIFDVKNNEMRLMVDGKQYLVSVDQDNKDAMLMMRTLKAEESSSGPIVNFLGKINRFLARINTSWSPEFIVSNLIRDFQTAGINIKDTGIENKKMFSGTKKAIKAIWAVERGKRKGTDAEKMYDRFKTAGAKIGWADVHGSIEKLSDKITKEIETAAGLRPTRKTVKGWLDFIENANTSIENGVRLHAFTLAVEQGFTDERAAQIASDLTVDFTKKGAAGPVINSLYLFANAGIQGSYRILRAATKSKKVQKILAGIVGAGFVIGMFNSLAGGEDDDGEDYYNKIEDHIRERNIIVMIPGTAGKYIKIPAPWGYNFVWNLGAELSMAFTRENYSPIDSMGRLANTFIGSFNPVQAGTLLQTLSPTVADPFVMVAENKNWFGGDLMPAINKFEKVPTPDSQRYWKSTSVPTRWVSETLNDLTGGDKIKKGMVDVSPETLSLILDTVGGSALRFFRDTINIPASAIKNEEIEAHKIPFARRVYGQQSPWTNSRLYYRNIEDVLVAKEQLKAYKGTAQYEALFKATKEYHGLFKLAQNTELSLAKLRKIKRAAEARNDKDAVKRIESRMDRIFIAFNKKFNSIK